MDLIKGNYINICFAINDSYTNHCCILIKSILAKIKKKYSLRIYIFHNNLSEPNKSKILKTSNYCAHFIQVDSTSVSELPIPKYSHFCEVNYFRLLIPRFLPDIDKVIYLDSDIIVNTDISDLWEIELEENYLACVEDNISESDRIRELTPLDNDFKYYNSGVLLLNCRKFRAENIENKLFAFGKKYYNQIYIVDQDLLNAVVNKQILYINKNWNYQINLELQNNSNLDIFKLKIIHYTGKKKAFHVNVFNKYAWPYYSNMSLLDICISQLNLFLKQSIMTISQNIKFIRFIYNSAKLPKNATIAIFGRNNFSKKILNYLKIKKYSSLKVIEPEKRKEEKEFANCDLFYPYALTELNADFLINTTNNKNINEYIDNLLTEKNIILTKINL